MRRTFTVRLVRPVFETIALEVEAWSKGSAIRKAIHRAQNAADSDWGISDVQGDDYSLHVEAVIDHNHVYEASPNPRREISAFKSMADDRHRPRYILLAAEAGAAMGHVLTQPWFNRSESELQTDLCSDWIEALDFIIENDGLEQDGIAAQHEDLHLHDNVIEFPPDPVDEEVNSHS